MSNPVEVLEEALREGDALDGAGRHGIAYTKLSRAVDEALALLRGPEPDWSQAPEWAQWWAVDADGEACWFDNEPYVYAYIWMGDRIIVVEECDLLLGCDWRLTLRQRPEGGR